MLTYGAQDHKIETHIDPVQYATPECISTVAEIMKYSRFKSGSFKFLPRDLKTLEQNGYTLTLKNGQMRCDDTLPFTDIHELTCDYYIGKPTVQTLPLRENSALFIKALVPIHIKTLSPDDDLDQSGEVDLPFPTHSLTPGMQILLEPKQKGLPGIPAVVKTVHPGCRLRGTHKTTSTMGTIVLELEGATGKYGPLCYLKPVESEAKKAKKQRITEEEAVAED
jgi:hypothetical protein